MGKLRITHLHKVTQLVRGQANNQIQVCQTPKLKCLIINLYCLLQIIGVFQSLVLWKMILISFFYPKL